MANAVYDKQEHQLGMEIFKIQNGLRMPVCIVYDRTSPRIPSILQKLQDKKYCTYE